MAKTIKYLSDGTIAKVGMIITYIGDLSEIATKWKYAKILVVKTIQPHSNGEGIIHSHENGCVTLKETNQKGFVVPCEWVRKATPEERKQYYQQLYSNQNG